VNRKLTTAWHQDRELAFVLCECLTGKYTVVARIKSINRNWATDFMFTRTFSFLGSISKGGKCPFCPPPADAHAHGSKFPALQRIVARSASQGKISLVDSLHMARRFGLNSCFVQPDKVRITFCVAMTTVSWWLRHFKLWRV